MSAPDLVVVSPGVQVIADYDEPIFFSDSFYWRNTGGAWYRSTEYTGGWARVEVAPAAIMSIDRPAAYVHYHGEARANAAATGPMVRDHREPQREPQRTIVQRPEPKAERKDERRDERKDERKEEKHDRN